MIRLRLMPCLAHRSCALLTICCCFCSYGQFEGTTSFRDASGGLSTWDTSNARSFARMFAAAASFRGDLSAWSVHHVRDFGFMFDGASEFQSDLWDWSTDSARTMEGMFRGAVQFNSASVDSFNVSQVTQFRNM